MSQHKFPLTAKGFLWEAQAGAILSTLYLILWAFANKNHSNGELGSFVGAGIALAIFGMLPSALLGGLTGAAVGKLLALFRRQLPGWVAALIGLIVSGLVVLLVFQPERGPSQTYRPTRYDYTIVYNWHDYLFFPLLPCLIYLLASSWVAVRLNRFNLQPIPLPQSLYVAQSYIDNIVYQIKDRYPGRTRYEIDLELLRDGYEPSEIEIAWKQFEIQLLEIARRRNLPPSLGVVTFGGAKLNLDFWLTIPSLLFLAGLVLYLLPNFLTIGLTVANLLIIAFKIRSRQPLVMAVALGSLPVFLLLSLS
jgi:hypothetical protein